MTDIDPRLLSRAMRWFGDGEWDVPMMIRLKVLTEKMVMDYWYCTEDSPGFDPVKAAEIQSKVAA
jgi:hypothetical protein